VPPEPARRSGRRQAQAAGRGVPRESTTGRCLRQHPPGTRCRCPVIFGCFIETAGPIAFAASLTGLADLDGERGLIGWVRVRGLVALGPGIGVEVGLGNSRSVSSWSWSGTIRCLQSSPEHGGQAGRYALVPLPGDQVGYDVAVELAEQVVHANTCVCSWARSRLPRRHSAGSRLLETFAWGPHRDSTWSSTPPEAPSPRVT
jgi:hypothetical protein